MPEKSHPKDPSQVSGWGRDEQGHEKQDFSDIANRDPRKPEFRHEQDDKRDDKGR